MKNTRTKDRNIGIIAHVDAGKTTVTERILFYSGATHDMGDVHHGNTTTDSDDVERKHGITINSAAVAVPWDGHRITIIDTPGHIDFNIEVRRALRVLDGAVVVFDGVAGVEPQSETNWQLADDFAVPRICFINKLDRRGADFEQVCEMIADQLGANPLPLQLPIGSEDSFTGVIDLVNQRAIVWDTESDPHGKKPEIQDMPAEMATEVEEAKQKLIDACVEQDEAVLERYLAGELPSEEEIWKCLRKGTLNNSFVPVLCGSAFKKKGIQPLLDAVVALLPAPEDRTHPDSLDDESLAALAFKTVAKGAFGEETYVRIYSGKLEEGDTVSNTSSGKRERVGRIYEIQADRHIRRKCATAGDIVAIPGLKHTSSGDTLAPTGSDLRLESFEIPEPVTSISVEAASRDDREKLGLGLARLVREDPTLRVRSDAETGQTVLAGMGELHLQMKRERLENELDIGIKFGQPAVSYRETITGVSEVDFTHKKRTGGPGQYARMVLTLEPLPRGEGIVFENRITHGAIDADYIPAVERGIRKQADNGVLTGSPVVDVKVALIDGDTHPNDSSATVFEFAAGRAFSDAMRKADPVLLEPLMMVIVKTPEEHLGTVIGDLNRRRGMITGQEQPEGKSKAVVTANVPLSGMFGYIDNLRSATAGRADYSMEFLRYEPVPSGVQQELLSA